MKTIIHVNQHKIKSNRKHGENEAVLTVKTYKSNTYAHEAIIRDANGEEVARVVYRPNKPLRCGAHVWIETHNEVRTSTDLECVLDHLSKGESIRTEEEKAYEQTCEAMDQLTNKQQEILIDWDGAL